MAPLDRLERGDEFAASSWPLHVTIVAPFSSAEAPDALGAALAEFASVHAPIAAIAGEPAMFGARRTVPVVLIEPSGELRSLHLDALAWLEERGVVLRPDAHSGAGYRPHASVRGRRSLATGTAVGIRSLALIDRAPGDQRGSRRVVAAEQLGAPFVRRGPA